MRLNYADQDAEAKFAGKFDATADVNAAITIPASSAEFWVLDAIGFSYSALPTTGRLVVAIGGVTIIDLDIRSIGHNYIRFSEPIYKGSEAKNEAMVITLHAGGASVVGKVFCRYR